jgi:hypothetical protein
LPRLIQHFAFWTDTDFSAALPIRKSMKSSGYLVLKSLQPVVMEMHKYATNSLGARVKE